MQGSFKKTRNTNLYGKNTTFGTADRDPLHNSKTPGPNKYHVVKFTEASHGYSFPVAPRTNENEVIKQSMLPGP